MDNNTNKRKYLTDTIFVAAISGYAYVLSYVYELGYCSRFHIPRYLITPNITTIIIVTIVLIILSAQVINLLNVFSSLFQSMTDDRKKAFHPFLKINGALLTAGAVLFILYYFTTKWYLWWLGITAIINFILFGIPLLLFKNKKTIVHKFNAINATKFDYGLYHIFVAKIGRRLMGILLFLLSLLLVAGFAGDSEAKRQKIYFVIINDYENILLKTYGDNMIFAKIDRSRGIFKNEIKIIHIPSYGPINLVEENIGPISTNSKPRIIQTTKTIPDTMKSNQQDNISKKLKRTYQLE